MWQNELNQFLTHDHGLFQLVEWLTHPSLLREALTFLLGLCVGSFLNVVALRSLQERSWINPPSACPHCQHRLGILDLVPVISYLWLQGRCRYCKAAISWHYPVVEVSTGILFVAVVHHFANISLNPNSPNLAVILATTLSMLVFVSILIAVTVTDFKELLIPHEITYPAIILGLLYTATIKVSEEPYPLLSALAGIGVSYILFDFLAFYGLKVYLLGQKETDESADDTQQDEAQKREASNNQSQKQSEKKTADDEDENTSFLGIANQFANAIVATIAGWVGLQELALPAAQTTEAEGDPQIDGAFDIAPPDPEEEEELEVMGGGDAVLSAVVAAWLGLNSMAMFLVVGFLAGTLMGGIYLVKEMHRQKILKLCLRPAICIGVLLLAFVESLLYCFWRLAPGSDMPWLPVGALALVGGAVLGVILRGRHLSRPFPFGPAMAVGALASMFYN